MSGIFSRTPYDECYADAYNRINRPYSDYSMLLDFHVNPSMARPDLKQCAHIRADVSSCAVCSANRNANFANTPTDFGRKVDIDGALRGVGRYLSYCNANKFAPCGTPSTSRLPLECDETIAITPLLCDRHIVPTNMKMRF
jgi:hypothetical protein